MSHRLAPDATSQEMDVIAKLTTAEERATDPGTVDALSVGLELIRALVADRGRRHEMEELIDDAQADSFTYDPPCPDE